MKATSLSLWCISTTVFASFSHAFISINKHVSCLPPRIKSPTHVQMHQPDENDGINLLEDHQALDNRRRKVLLSLLSLQQLSRHPSLSHAAQSEQQLLTENSSSSSSSSSSLNGIHDTQLQNYYNPLLPNWKGTALPGPLSISDAYSQLILPSSSLEKSMMTSSINNDNNMITTTTFPMGRWPDPILRKVASPIPKSIFENQDQLHKLQTVAEVLRNTARAEGAVGLAAQQCGIDASLVFIDGVSTLSANDGDRMVIESNGIHAEHHSVISLLSLSGGMFGQSNWRNSKKQITGEGVVDDYSSRGLLPRFDRATNRIDKQSPPPPKQDGIFLVNPRIIYRSPESEMLVWTEECLVLPPQFKATLLRDAEVTIEYETLTMCSNGKVVVDGCCDGETKQITLRGELARCAQHEMDHDRGVLIVDHVGLDELLSIKGEMLMANVENSDGLHENRMKRAYTRNVYDSLLLPSARTQKNVELAFGNGEDYLSKIEQVESVDLYASRRRSWFVPSANAAENVPEKSALSMSAETTPTEDDRNTSAPAAYCDEACMEERKRRIQQRRAMMQQSRSSTSRGDVLELSRQRAAMYGTSYKGLSPSACDKPGFCP